MAPLQALEMYRTLKWSRSHGTEKFIPLPAILSPPVPRDVIITRKRQESPVRLKPGKECR